MFLACICIFVCPGNELCYDYCYNSFVFLISIASIVQELCESRGGRPELSVLTSLLASVDVKIY